MPRWRIDRRQFLVISASGAAVVGGCVPSSDGTADLGAGGVDLGNGVDLGMRDAGNADQGQLDAGSVDSGTEDAGELDQGMHDTGAGPECDDPFAGGTFIGEANFVGETSSPREQKLGRGWDARYYTDLKRVTQEDPLIPNDSFYIRTEMPDLLTNTDNWSIDVRGLVDNPTPITAEQLNAMSRPMGPHVLECAGNHRGGAYGLLSAAEWDGVLVEDVLGQLSLQPGAQRLLVSGFDMHSVPSNGGHSTPGAEWSFSFQQLMDAGAFFATRMGGQPLPPDHGFPVRLYVPNWYGCSCIKWVDAIEVTDNDVPATSQMREFASRTHQSGTPVAARDYRPAFMEQAAMPISIERWNVNGETVYRVVGIMWGGAEPTDKLEIRFGRMGAWTPVDVCPVQTQNTSWTVWSHAWRPSQTGTWGIRMRINDANIPTIRLDSDFYYREVSITQV